MMADIEPPNDLDVDDLLLPLQRSLLAVLGLFALCLLLAVVSAGMFVFQFRYRDEFGNPFTDEPGAWPHLLGHMLRGAIGAGLAWCLLRYMLAIRKTTTAGTHHFRNVFVSMARCWYALATGAVVLLIYSLTVTFAVPARGTPGRHLSPQYRFNPAEESPVKVELRLAEEDPADDLIEATVAGTPRTIYLHATPLITNEDVVGARAALDDKDRPVIDIQLSPAAGDRMRDATRTYRGSLLAILIDDEVIQAPTINGPVGERARIQGNFSEEEARRIARSLAGKH
jgi:hypothetical protein